MFARRTRRFQRDGDYPSGTAGSWALGEIKWTHPQPAKITRGQTAKLSVSVSGSANLTDDARVTVTIKMIKQAGSSEPTEGTYG